MPARSRRRCVMGVGAVDMALASSGVQVRIRIGPGAGEGGACSPHARGGRAGASPRRILPASLQPRIARNEHKNAAKETRPDTLAPVPTRPSVTGGRARGCAARCNDWMRWWAPAQIPHSAPTCLTPGAQRCNQARVAARLSDMSEGGKTGSISRSNAGGAASDCAMQSLDPAVGRS